MDLIDREKALGCFWAYEDGDETEMPAYDRLQALPIVAEVEDCISRQDAIEAVENAFDRETILNRFVRKIAISAIRLLPSAQPETEKRTAESAQNVPNGELISKKAAIDAIDRTDWYHVNNKGELVHGANSKDDVPLYKAEDIYKAIEQLPSAQTMHWIPVTERLPEDKQPVIFSTKTGRVHQGKYYKDGSVNQWYSALDKMRAFNNVVNAWMPLPEPWKEEQDGSD